MVKVSTSSLNVFNSLDDHKTRKVTDEEKPNLRGDYRNVALLLLFYSMQGVPQGIGLAIPILLQNRGVSYTDQAQFSFSFFPYSMKLLWAPIVDSIYLKAFGRRKSWICLSQLIIGIFMIFLSNNIELWMSGDELSDSKPKIAMLTIAFSFLWFLTSCQDIAVDGWGLTLLQRRNVGYAATCNSIGQSAGRFIGFIVLLMFESKEFCNEFIFQQPQSSGLFTLSSFLMFWGILYLTLTAFIAMFKREEYDDDLENHPDYGISRAYPILLEIFKLKPVIQLGTMIFTVEATFAVWDCVTSLKLVEYGISKDKIALLQVPTAPLQILTPLLITRYTTRSKPLSFYFKVFPCRLFAMVFTAIFVYYTPTILASEVSVPKYFYITLIFIFTMDQVLLRATYSADGGFLVKIADPLIGGTYMTLLNTCGNLGKRVATTLLLWLLDFITWKNCNTNSSGSLNFTSTHDFSLNTCSNHDEKTACIENGGFCETVVDGYYIEMFLSLIYGLIWMKIFKSVIYQLQRYPREDWYVLTKTSEICEEMKAINVI